MTGAQATAGVGRWWHTFVWIVEFEPTWFPEFGFALGAVGWGVSSLLTDDYTVEGWARLLPALACVLGLIRMVSLLWMVGIMRVITATLGAFLIAWLSIGLISRFGIIGTMGWYGGIFVVELLTMAKFSIRSVRQLTENRKATYAVSSRSA